MCAKPAGQLCVQVLPHKQLYSCTIACVCFVAHKDSCFSPLPAAPPPSPPPLPPPSHTLLISLALIPCFSYSSWELDKQSLSAVLLSAIERRQNGKSLHCPKATSSFHRCEMTLVLPKHYKEVQSGQSDFEGWQIGGMNPPTSSRHTCAVTTTVRIFFK